jgi:hypothetical protein
MFIKTKLLNKHNIRIVENNKIEIEINNIIEII